MAQMNRNVNLEEIDSDALFGIEALKNQTLVQKLVFFTELETVTKLYLESLSSKVCKLILFFMEVRN